MFPNLAHNRKRSVAGRARAVGCLTEPRHRFCLPGRVANSALTSAHSSRTGGITRPAREFRQTLPGPRRNATPGKNGAWVLPKRKSPDSCGAFPFGLSPGLQIPSFSFMNWKSMMELTSWEPC